ncbi:MAG: type 1 fimbrial protein [Stenotrophomonas sp.]|nr:type 1 fimbrial protein [Stenotrophomonas sp.]
MIARSLLCVTLLCGAGSAWAQSCVHPPETPTPYQVTLPLQGTITVGADLPIGTEIYTSQHQSASVAVISCTGGPGVVRRTSDYVGSPGRPSTLPGIYETSIPGVGIAMWFAGTKFPAHPAAITLDGPTLRLNFSKWVDFSLYKIGPISAGVLQGSSLPHARSYTEGAGSINIWESQIVGQLNIVTGTCRVADVTVPLGRYRQRDFNAIGRVSGWRDYDIELSGCPAFFGNQAAYSRRDSGTIEVPGRRVANKIGIRLDPSTPILDAARSIMAVQGTPGNRPAEGIGIQVALPTNTSVGFGTFHDSGLTLTTAANGSYRIPMRARYIQLEDRVRPGPANGAMVVTLRYE